MYERPIRPDELYHYGVLGMKWGVRRYQNSDGTRTSLGKKHERIFKDIKREAKKTAKSTARTAKKIGRMASKNAKRIGSNIESGVNAHRAKVKSEKEAKVLALREARDKRIRTRNESRDKRRAYIKQVTSKEYWTPERRKKAIKIGAAVVGGTLLAAYGAKKISTIKADRKQWEAVRKMMQEYQNYKSNDPKVQINNKFIRKTNEQALNETISKMNKWKAWKEVGKEGRKAAARHHRVLNKGGRKVAEGTALRRVNNADKVRKPMNPAVAGALGGAGSTAVVGAGVGGAYALNKRRDKKKR